MPVTLFTGNHMSIPEKFYKGDDQPCAYTVGELIEILQELPPDLCVDMGFDTAAVVVVYNHGKPHMHVAIEESDALLD